MADDSKIQVIDFLKDVESNRRSLIANAQSKGKIIDNGASLTQAVAINNTIEPSASPEKIEVRFFDADGTLLQTNYIDYGGSVTPPPNPSYDPERLTFKRWASAIGERFDNITHDVDYGALYTINDGAYHLFCTFNDETGYMVTLPVDQNTSGHTITIDWGDGTPNDTTTNSGTTNISHTYAQAGDYEIIVSSDTPINYPTYYFCLYYYILSTSRSDDVINALINAYMPILYSSNLEHTSNVQTVICEGTYSLNNVYNVKNLILSNSYNSSDFTIYLYTQTTFIIDNTVYTDNDEHINLQGTASVGVYLDKLIIPASVNFSFSLQIYVNKIIVLSPKIEISPNTANLYRIKSLQFLNLNPGQILQSITSAYSLEEYIYPNNIAGFDEYIASNSKLKSVTIPPNCVITIRAFLNMYNLETINLPVDFNQSFSVSSYVITVACMIDMLNKVKDNTGEIAQTIKFSQIPMQMQLLNTFVVLDNGIWVLATRTTPNAMTLVEAFNEKNWTIT